MGYKVVIDYEGRERLVGFVEGQTLICKRNEEKHMFRGGHKSVEEAKRDGTASWGLDCKVCDGLISRGVQWLEIVGKSCTYRCTLEDMCMKGYVLNIKPHRAQYFLNLEHFEMRCGNER